MDEYEKLEGDMKKCYEEYMVRSLMKMLGLCVWGGEYRFMKYDRVPTPPQR